jgi:cell division protein FtsZ
MVGKGMTLMGTGEAKGENRAEEATHKTLHSPLLDNMSIQGATGILYNITAASNLTLVEIEKISDMITRNADSDATIKFGVIEDESLGDTLRVTVVATGFREGEPVSQSKFKTSPMFAGKTDTPHRQPTPQLFLNKNRLSPSGVDITGYINEGNMPSMSHGPEDFDDPLDIPTFQRQSSHKKK